MSRVVLGAMLLAACSCSAGTAKERRDVVIQTGLEAGRASCLMLQSDRSIEREPGVDAYCAAVLNGCPK